MAVQYSEVNAETFHNEIEEVISRYPVEILHDGDDSEEDSVSHPLNKVRLQNDAAMGNVNFTRFCDNEVRYRDTKKEKQKWVNKHGRI